MEIIIVLTATTQSLKMVLFFTRNYVGERYLPKTSSQFLLLFLLILLVIFQIPHSHGHKQRDNTISCVFDGGWFWVMCVSCVSLEKKLFIKVYL